MIESILYKTAIYCRLSLDDGSLGESDVYPINWTS